MGFNPVIFLFSFATALYLVNSLNAAPILASLVAVVFPFLVNCTILWILKFNIWLDILSIANVTTLVLQFTIAYFVFTKIRDTDSLTETFGWSVGGLLVLFFVPAIIHAIH